MAGNYASATIKSPRETMEAFKQHTETRSKKTCIETIVNKYIVELEKKYRR